MMTLETQEIIVCSSEKFQVPSRDARVQGRLFQNIIYFSLGATCKLALARAAW